MAAAVFRRRVATRLTVAIAALFLCLSPLLANANELELPTLEVVRTDDGLMLSFVSRFELPRTVEDALQKGIPLHFLARIELFRSRWYWRDQRIADVSRTWRLAYQPLTRRYRVTFGSLNQNYDTLVDAMAAIRRVTQWKVIDNSALDNDAHHYVEFSYRLDTSQLPRPMQIGITGQPEWTLSVERTISLD
ncbi:MAG: hypothetical protein JWQ11_3985 [Rhizobacter sp.]|nr:hypothetical protein [Rhizobacter sp.]